MGITHLTVVAPERPSVYPDALPDGVVLSESHRLHDARQGPGRGDCRGDALPPRPVGGRRATRARPSCRPTATGPTGALSPATRRRCSTSPTMRPGHPHPRARMSSSGRPDRSSAALGAVHARAAQRGTYAWARCATTVPVGRPRDQRAARGLHAHRAGPARPAVGGDLPRLRHDERPQVLLPVVPPGCLQLAPQRGVPRPGRAGEARHRPHRDGGATAVQAATGRDDRRLPARCSATS